MPPRNHQLRRFATPMPAQTSLSGSHQAHVNLPLHLQQWENTRSAPVHSSKHLCKAASNMKPNAKSSAHIMVRRAAVPPPSEWPMIFRSKPGLPRTAASRGSVVWLMIHRAAASIPKWLWPSTTPWSFIMWCGLLAPVKLVNMSWSAKQAGLDLDWPFSHESWRDERTGFLRCSANPFTYVQSNS